MAYNYDAELDVTNISDISSDIAKIRTQKDVGGFKMGVVLEYFDRADLYPESGYSKLAAKGAVISKIKGAPPNSVLVMPVENGSAHNTPSPLICFPMLSHIKMPIKAGEFVWYFTLDETPAADSYGYWLSRVVGEYSNEDSNYTHYDRKHFPYVVSEYPNGARTAETATLPGGPDAYNDLVADSLSIKNFIPTSSPRYPSKSCTNVMAGSHRNVVMLGDVAGEGYIDIIAGVPKPKSVRTSRGWEEMDKNDPLPDNELITNFTKGDSKISLYESLSFDGGDIIEADFKNPPLRQLITEKSGSFILTKSDHIRTWANDSVRIGSQSGQLVIENDEVYLGSNDITIGPGTPVSNINLGSGASESAVLGNELNNFLNSFINIIENTILPTPFGSIPLSTAFSGGQPLVSELNSLRFRINNHLSNIVKVK
jgi:hypothetical protein